MRARYTELSGIVPEDATDIGIRLQVLAGELAKLYEMVTETERQLFPQTSSGTFLDAHGELRGIERKAAQPARGIVKFSRQTGAASDIVIPADTLLATTAQPPQYYITTQEAVLKAGKLAVEVSAMANSAGPVGNLAPGKIALLVTPVSGIEQVENPAAFTGGLPREEDEAYCERVLASYRGNNNGTNAAYYYDLTANYKGVRLAKVLPRKRGRGTVDVVIAVWQPEQVEQIREELYRKLYEKREIGVDVAVVIAKTTAQPLEVEILTADGIGFAAVSEACKQAVQSYFKTIGIGEPLLLAHLGRRLLEVPGVINYRFTQPLADVSPLADTLLTCGEAVLREWGS